MTENHSIQAVENAEKSATPPTKKKSPLRWLWRSLLLVALLLAALIAVLATGKGQRSAVMWLNDLLEPLSISQVEGSLQDGLRLSGVSFAQPGVNVVVQQAELQLGFSCLWQMKACVEKVSLQGAEIVVDTTQLPPPEPRSESRGEFSLPLAVELNALTIDNIRVQVDATDITLSHFHSGLHGQGKQLTLLPTELRGLTVSLPPQAVENPQKVANQQAEPIDWPALKAKLSEPLLDKNHPFSLPLALTVQDFQVGEVVLEQKTTTGEPQNWLTVDELRLKTTADEAQTTLHNLTLQSNRGNLHATGSLGNLAPLPLDLQLNAEIAEWPQLGLPASQLAIRTNGELFGQTRLHLTTQGVAEATVSGEVKLSEPKMPFNLTMASNALRYPFNAQPQEQLQIRDLALNLMGNLLDYRLNGGVAVEGMGVPPARAQINGQGGIDTFQLDKLLVESLKGTSTLQGHLNWQQGLEWQADLALENLNTRELLPQWWAMVSGKLQSQGYIGRGASGQDWAISFNDISLTGALNKKLLILLGSLTADNKQGVNTPSVKLLFGENLVDLKGVLSEQSDFVADINAPNLAGLLPKLNGHLVGNLKLLGQISAPQLQFNLTSNQLSFDQFKLQGFTAKGDITTYNQVQGELALGLNKFNLGEVEVSNAKLNLSGSEQDHRLSLAAAGNPIGLNFNISGKFDRLQQQWQGQLSDVLLGSPVGNWKTNQPFALGYDHRRIMANIAPHCWLHSQAQLCFPQAFEAGVSGKVPFELKQFDLAMVQPFLAENSQVVGKVNAIGEALWSENAPPKAQVELTSPQIAFTQKIDYRSLPLVFSPVKIGVTLADNNLGLTTDIRLENNGRLISDVQLKDLTKSRGLAGKVNLEGLHFGILKPFVGKEEQLDGELNARLTLGGNLTAPQLFGDVTLSRLGVRMVAMPFDVLGGNVRMAFNGAKSTFNGSLQTKESELKLEGDANWQNLNAWSSRMRAVAERLRLDIPGIARLDVSPDIQANVNPRELLLRGKVDIPWGRIALEQLPESTVTVSVDEMIMDGSVLNRAKLPLPKVVKTDHGGMLLNGDIDLNIGNDVRLDAYGLKTHLYGGLKVRQGSKGLGLYGQVNLKDGTFASFGQDLVIRKGIISFTGLPSQPTLDVEAIRNPEAMEDSTITAGVRVTGIADAPDVKIFSSPTLPQDQALAYILTGRGLSGGDSNTSNSVAAALIGLSLSKSSKLVGTVGSAFGISDLNVTTAGIGDNTKVVVSGSITPKFKVQYGVGLFAPLSELTLRYRLATNLYVQWLSSVNQAVDLMYRFEF